jgi:hypothetical protein
MRKGSARYRGALRRRQSRTDAGPSRRARTARDRCRPVRGAAGSQSKHEPSPDHHDAKRRSGGCGDRREPRSPRRQHHRHYGDDARTRHAAVRATERDRPRLSRVAILWRPGTLSPATIEKVQRDIEASANPAVVRVQLVGAGGAEDFDTAFSTIKVAVRNGSSFGQSDLFSSAPTDH